MLPQGMRLKKLCKGTTFFLIDQIFFIFFVVYAPKMRCGSYTTRKKPFFLFRLATSKKNTTFARYLFY